MLLRDLCISQGDPVPSCFSFTLPLPPAFSSLSLLHLPSCSYSYFSLIASSEPCSSPLTWRLLPTSSWLLRPYKDLPPITNHSSSQFPFAHSGTNHFQEGIARGLCHRLHIFCSLNSSSTNNVDCNAVLPASCININACPFPPPWQAACQSMPRLERLATHNASALLPLIHWILANTRMHHWQTIFYIGYYFPEWDVCAGAV